MTLRSATALRPRRTMKAWASVVWPCRGIILILVLFLAVGLFYSVANPIFEAPDEVWHYSFIKHLADGQGLPLQYPDQRGPWQQEGGQPPLYYALGALLTRGIDTGDVEAVRRLNPHADVGVVTRDRNTNMTLHSPRERFPSRGTTLAVHLVRWVSLLMGAVTVLSGYLLVREVHPQDKMLALTAS